MPLTTMKRLLILPLLSLLFGCSESRIANEYTNNSIRSPSYIERDPYRHPNSTLDFFEISDSQTVVEIWPGGGWYAEILAPYLSENGQYYAAHFPKDSNIGFFSRMRAKFDKSLIERSNVYKNTITTSFQPPLSVEIAPASSADSVLTFRNVHNWMRNDGEQAAFDSFYKALKPGGLLGVVEHRAPQSFNIKEMIDSGYVSEEYVKKLASKSGFVFEASSEINANAKDSKSHPKGVWTLPPSLRLGDRDKNKYLAIGESDRMTLKFRKPK